MTIRPATDADLAAVATLHADRIVEGFLSSLGTGFLRRLYRRVLRSEGGFVLVAADPAVQGFVAGVPDVGALYREFLLRDGIVAGAVAAPKLFRALPRVVETLRYPATTGELPDAEILAVAVGAEWGGRGIGRELVRTAIGAFVAAGVHEAKVVTTADNAAALAMYRAADFTSSAPVEVHAGRASEVLVWRAS